MRILCMIPAMSGPGGAERTMSYLVTRLAERHDVALLTLEASGVQPFYALAQPVRVIPIDKLGGRGLNRLFRVLSRPLRIRREIRALAPDVIVSFMDTMNITAIVSAFDLRIPVVVSERNDPALHRIGALKEFIRTIVYRGARTIVVQTNRIASYFPSALQKKVRVVPNPIVEPSVRAHPEGSPQDGPRRLIAIGSFKPQKGFDRLIDAFALIADKHTDWELHIHGDGPERTALERRIANYNLEGRVLLRGITQDIFGELASSQLMAFPSYYEGFPNALAEALAAGVPAVGYSGVSGAEELIVDGGTGLLVDAGDGVAGFARALSALMIDGDRRKRLGEAARLHMRNWSPEHIFPLWEETLEAARLNAPASYATAQNHDSRPPSCRRVRKNEQ